MISFGKANGMRESRRDGGKAEDIGQVAISVLAFLAGRPEDLARFLALSGIGPQNLRDAARDPGFLTGVIDFLMSDEKLLVAFAEHAGIAPERLAAIAAKLNPEAW
jgi:hypothetical protein